MAGSCSDCLPVRTSDKRKLAAALMRDSRSKDWGSETLDCTSPSPWSLPQLRRRSMTRRVGALQKIEKHRSELTFAAVPFSERNLVQVRAGRHDVVNLAAGHQAPRVVAGPARVDAVVAGDDASRNAYGAQFGFRRADHRLVGAGDEVLAPVRHYGDEALRVHRHQARAVLGPHADALAEELRVAYRRHAAAFGKLDEVGVVLARQVLGRDAPAGHTP